MTKTILVTGGGRGIGAATARLAGARGWSVGVNFAGNADAAAKTVLAVSEAGGRAIAIQGDVSVEADVLDMFDKTERAFGSIDGVVINAGILDVASQIADMQADRLRKVFEINVFGAFLTAREAARRLSKARGGQGGSIVVVSSAAARLGGANERIDYAASKGAMDTMVTGMAQELGPEGVRVNSVRPGLIYTDIHASGGQPDRADALGGGTPMGRAGTPEEVGEAIVWLLDDTASYVTGTMLDVTGGR